jgi:hypothetical protein
MQQDSTSETGSVTGGTEEDRAEPDPPLDTVNIPIRRKEETMEFKVEETILKNPRKESPVANISYKNSPIVLKELIQPETLCLFK